MRLWRKLVGPMDAISTAGLVAMAGSAGGAAGTQLWAALVDLIRRPFGPGVRELEELEQAPGDRAAADALVDVLRARASSDPQFARALSAWDEERVRLMAQPGGAVSNTITGGRQGNVLQTREIHGGVSFGAATAPEQRARE